MSNKTFIHGDLLLMNVSWASGNLQLYENQSEFEASVIFTITNGVILLMAFIVHKAVYKLLARLPNRAINHIIYPSMVSNLLHLRLKKILKVGFFQKVKAKFSNLSKWHSCEPKIVPELLFPVCVIDRILVIFWIHLAKKSAYHEL